MSRHRIVRNMNIEEELNDEAFSDGGEDDLTQEDYDRLVQGLEQIRAAVGPAEQSGMSDQQIKETLHYYYFDVNESLNWLLEQQGRKRAAEERRDGKSLPLLPGQEEILSPPRIIAFNEGGSGDGRSNVPLIRLGPEEPDDFFYSTSAEDDSRSHDKLSTITERTELSEYSHDWPLPVEPPPPVQRHTSMTSYASTSDYGQVIERTHVEDPNHIPPSPTLSALQRLSMQEPPPTASSTGSRTPTQETAVLPIVEPDLPVDPPPVPPKPSLRSLAKKAQSQSSISTVKAAAAAPGSNISTGETETTGTVTPKKPKSKLSALASSRSSVSSRTSDISSVRSGSSVVTYPHLRPAPQSVISLPDAQSSITSSSSSLPDDAESSITKDSSLMSSHARRAVEAALLLEAADSPPKRRSEQTTKSLSRPVSDAGVISHTPRPREAPVLLQSPAASHTSNNRPPSQPAVSPQPPSASESKPKVSKLAQLAQVKAQQSQAHWMPKPKRPVSEGSDLMTHKSHTEYLTPIANGPTATTAITTSYQSLASLARPSRSDPDAQNTVDMFSKKHSRSPVETKQSKLAMKSRKAQKTMQPEPQLEPEPEPEPALSALDLPTMFMPLNIQPRASPSAFASVLLNDEAPSAEAAAPKTKDKGSSRAREHKEIVEKTRRRTHKRNEVPPPPGLASPADGFAFDVPSPDDVVFKARRGTSLAQRSSSTTTHLPPSTTSASSSNPPVPSR
ncbi:hypothetical protein BDW22DRAFT_525378 [Trametopsis cervina]|nr:hypothetical protein BDW22DRAFT_525378 [Trametopsis cervina]